MRHAALAALILIATASAPAQVAEKANAHYATPGQRSALARGMADPSRDQEEKPRELVASLSITAGMAVADIGTGPGYMLPFLSEAVGPRGRILAEDIFPDFLDVARRRAEAAHLPNVTLILGTQTDPKPPAGSLDLAFLLDVYHHFNYPGPMLAHLRDSLRDGGRLVVVDYYRRRDAMPFQDALEHIRLDRPEVIQEVEASGFSLLSKHDHIANSQYVLIFRKPGSGLSVSPLEYGRPCGPLGERRANRRKGDLNEPMNELERWANFYLLTSAAAATLIGLLFVVIALGSERSVEDGTAKIRMYLTPTVVYFASVLFLAALLTFPNHTRLTATLCTCLPGVVGLVYSGTSLIGGGDKSLGELHDRVLYAIVPFAAYGLVVLGGVLLLHDPQRGLTLVAVGMLSLLTLGIRNSWAIAIDVVSTRPGRRNSK